MELQNVNIKDFSFELAKKNLNKILTEKGIKQKDLIALLGANQSDVSKKLNGKNEKYKYIFFNVEELFKICCAYGLSMDKLTGLSKMHKLNPTSRTLPDHLLDFAKSITYFYKDSSSGFSLKNLDVTELKYFPVHDEVLFFPENDEIIDHDGFEDSVMNYPAMYFSVNKPRLKNINPFSLKFNIFLNKLKKYAEWRENQDIEPEDYDALIDSALKVLEKELKELSIA